MTNDEAKTPDDSHPSDSQPKDDGADKPSLGYDLEERTARFSEDVIVFVRKLGRDEVTRPLILQLVRSATSVGANYCEANDSESKKMFRHNIATCRKESKETKYWLRIIAKAVATHRDEAAKLWQEAKELNLIFSAIYRNSKGRDQ